MSMRPLSRRTFLRGGGATAIVLPLLEAMRSAKPAQANGDGKRLVIFAQPLSLITPHFWPLAPGSAVPEVTAEDLPSVAWSGKGASDNAAFTLSRVLQPLAPHESDLLVLEGFENCDGNHGAYMTTLSGSPESPEGGASNRTLDHVVADHLGAGKKFPSLQIGVMNDGSQDKSHASWYGPKQPAVATGDPAILFDRLFADFASDPMAAARLRARGQSILDQAMNQATKLKSRLGKADQLRVDQYLASLRSVESRLGQTGGGAGCTRPNPPTLPSLKDVTKGNTAGGRELVPDFMKAQMELAVMALSCDLTPVVTFQPLFEASNYTFPWLKVGTRHHDLSHYKGGDKARAQEYVDVSTWFITEFGRFIQLMKDAGIFENSLLVTYAPMGNGQRHNSANIPVLLAGSAGGHFRTGRHVRYEGENRRINDVWVTVAQAMGLAIDTFGHGPFNNGPLRNLRA